MVADLDDARRSEPEFVLPEREMLEDWLEFHRTTLLLKCEGLDDASRKRRPVSTSLLSLHDLVRHMAEVERGWFRRVLRREPDAPRIWLDPPSTTASWSPSTTPTGTPTSPPGRRNAFDRHARGHLRPVDRGVPERRPY